MTDAESRSQAFVGLSVPAAYDRYMRPQLFEPWARDLLQAAGVKPGQRVLDVASGTGVVAHLAAALVGPTGSVTASDISAPMLAISAGRERSRDAAPLTFVVCSAMSLNFPDASFDVVLCQQGLPFIPDRRAALAEMKRVLVSGGVAAVSVWVDDRPHGLFTPLVQTFANSGLPEPFPGAYDAATYNMSSEQLREAFRSAGFNEVHVETRSIIALWPDLAAITDAVQGTPFGPMLAALPPEARQRIRRDFAGRLDAHPDGSPIRCETHAHVGLGTA